MTPKEIKTILKEKKITQWQLCQKIGIHEKTIIMWFHADVIRADRLQKINAAIDEIIRERESTNG